MLKNNLTFLLATIIIVPTLTYAGNDKERKGCDEDRARSSQGDGNGSNKDRWERIACTVFRSNTGVCKNANEKAKKEHDSNRDKRDKKS